MTTRFTVIAADCAGRFDTFETEVLLVATRVRDEWRAQYPHATVDVFDQERDGRVVEEDA